MSQRTRRRSRSGACCRRSCRCRSGLGRARFVGGRSAVGDLKLIDSERPAAQIGWDRHRNDGELVSVVGDKAGEASC